MSARAGLPEVVIVGGATLLGQELKELISSRSLPISRVRLVAAAQEEEAPGLHARLSDFGGEAVVETPLSASEFEGAAIVFICDPAVSGHPVLEAAACVIDLTRGGKPPDPSYRLAIAGLEPELAAVRRIASPHPVTVMLGHVLRALAPLEPQAVVATAMIGASHSGRAGVEELLEQTRSALTFSGGPKSVFDRQLAFNLFPPFGERGPEGGIAAEIAALTGCRAAVSLVTVPIFYGVAATLHLELRGAQDLAAVEAVLRRSPDLSLKLDEDTSPVGVVGDDAVVVGALAADAARPGAFWLWTVCDNARRGGALNAVEIAEKLLLA